MRVWTFFIFFILTAVSSSADEIFLKNGRVLEGVVIEQTDTQVVIELAAGKMSLPASMVERIEAAPSRLTDFESRAADLAEDDVKGWLELAFWAADHRLDTRARSTFEKVLSIDPAQVVAMEILGQISDEASLAPKGWKPSRKHVEKESPAFSTPWTLDRLAPNFDRSAPGRALERILSLAVDCRWAEAAWRLRALLESDSKLPEKNLRPVLFALEVAAHTSSGEVNALFSPDEASFHRKECLIFLSYENTSPVPWEWDGSLESVGDKVDLSGDTTLRFRVPFRRPGVVRHQGSNDTLEGDVLLEARLLGLPPKAHVSLGWWAVLLEEDPWDENTKHSMARIKARTGENTAWAEVEATWRHQAASFSKRTDLPGAYFTEGHSIRSTVDRDVVRFGLDQEVTESLNLPASERLYLRIDAQGDDVALDWISLSGPIDGAWLAQRLGQRALRGR